jgi:hypothetical protein
MATTGDRLEPACPFHAAPVQECSACNPLSEHATRGPLPAQLPEPAPAPEPLSVQDLDDFISNLQQRKVKRFAYTGNIKGAPVVLEVQFEQQRARSTEEDLG